MFDLYDKDENFVCQSSESDAQIVDLYKRSVHIFVFNQQSEILLCKRPNTKQFYPGVFTSSAGGHVEYGETFLVAAYREMQEEINLHCPLIEYGRYDVINRIERAIHYLYLCYPSELDLKTIMFDPLEISEAKYFNIDILKKEIVNKPEMFAYPFIKGFEFYISRLTEIRV